MSSKLWFILGIVLVVAGIVAGGAFVGIFGAAATGAAVQAARKREREQIEREQEIERKKKAKVEAIEKDFKTESRVLQHLSSHDLKREILSDLDDLDTRR
jgi:hypothetical protein